MNCLKLLDRQPPFDDVTLVLSVDDRGEGFINILEGEDDSSDSFCLTVERADAIIEWLTAWKNTLS